MNKKSAGHLWANILALVTIFLLMASAAMLRDGTLFGHDLTVEADAESAAVYRVENADGSVTINTSAIGPEVTGYAGPVPVEIEIADGKVRRVEPLDNVETPGFFERVTESGLLDKWNGLTPEEALAADVDAVTGATFSSTALIANVRAGLQKYVDADASAPSAAAERGWAFYVAVVVVLMAALLPLRVHDRRYRTVQQLLNVAVLGFWAGTFVDYTVVLGVLAHGWGAAASLVTLAMFVVAFIYPLFGHHGHYCAWVCPLGSLQELVGQCNPHHKLKLGPTTLKWLRRFRPVLWMGLMLCLWTGFFVSWIDYELFTAFMVREAATGVVVAGGVVTVLSLFVQRPYCRFVCPTGSLLRLSENLDSE